MANSDQILIQFRMDKKTRDEAGKILKSMGTDIPTYLRMAIKRVILEQGIPFSTTLPEKEAKPKTEKKAKKVAAPESSKVVEEKVVKKPVETPKPVAVKEEPAEAPEVVAVKTEPKESPKAVDDNIKETIAKIKEELHAAELVAARARRAELEAFKAEQEAKRAEKLAAPKPAPRSSADEPILFDKINVEIAEARAEMDAEIERQKEEAELKKLLWEKRKMEIRKGMKPEDVA